MKVKNLKGTADNKVPSQYSSWLDYWKTNKGYSFNPICKSCKEKVATLGGHVKKVYGSNEWYITPLCDSCNRVADEFEVAETDLIRIP